MTTTRPAPADGPPIAPAWHTVALVLLHVAVAVTGLLLQTGRAPPTPPTQHAPGRMALYLPFLVVQWSQLVYVSWIGRPRGALGALVFPEKPRLRRVLVDLVLALAGYVLIESAELVWSRLFASARATSVAAMLPHTPLECLAWALVSLTAAVCEEVVFRGYLQTQLTAFTGRASVAVVLQAVLFGVAHGEQGGVMVVRIVVYGLALGALARWRRSLVPGIVCHFLIDLTSGILPFLA